jgi:hypothetical protein
VCVACALLTRPASPNTRCRQWNARNIPLLLDKNPNVRQMAAKALSVMYSMDPHAVRRSWGETHHLACCDSRVTALPLS